MTIKRRHKKEESIRARPWEGDAPPGRILAIRLQALGDVTITLPYLQGLRGRMPEGRLDFLTREECREIPQRIELFDNVYGIGGRRNPFLQSLSTVSLLPSLNSQRYDIVIDLQRNSLSKMIRCALNPTAWSEFDRFSPLPSGTRTRMTIEAAGTWVLPDLTPLRLKHSYSGLGLTLLERQGWRQGIPFVVLNPAGAFPSRNWPLDNYVQFAALWKERVSGEAKFLTLGLEKIAHKAFFLKEKIGNSLIDLTGQTSPSEALNILKRSSLVISEDSGLMHMAWAAGVPAVALLGSSRGDWTAPPPGTLSACFHSGDLDCGFCMEEVCPRGNLLCLKRHTPEQVLAAALQLVEKREQVPVKRTEPLDPTIEE